MISQALVQRMEGRRVSHSWCTCVDILGNGGLGGGGDGMHARQSQGGLVACQEMPDHFPSAR